MKKTTFGIDCTYTKTENGYKKSNQVYPRWSEINESVKIEPGQTTVMRMGEEFGLMCLDLDTKDLSHPDHILMAELIYQLAPTCVQESQNGYHFFYKWDKRLAKSAAKITKAKDSKLDIKSNMGLINIDAPVPYYKWWETRREPQEFTDEMWKVLRPHLTNKYLGIPLERADEIEILDKIIEDYEENPSENNEKKLLRQQRKIDNYDKIINFDDSKVQHAKDYPIRVLLNEPTATMIRCISPDHDDKNPSMQITGNFAYCHSCGFHADSLEVYQILNNATFPEALNFLTHKNG